MSFVCRAYVIVNSICKVIEFTVPSSVTLIKTCMADGLGGGGVRRTCRLHGGFFGYGATLKLRARALNALI